MLIDAYILFVMRAAQILNASGDEESKKYIAEIEAA